MSLMAWEISWSVVWWYYSRRVQSIGLHMCHTVLLWPRLDFGHGTTRKSDTTWILMPVYAWCYSSGAWSSQRGWPTCRTAFPFVIYYNLLKPFLQIEKVNVSLYHSIKFIISSYLNSNLFFFWDVFWTFSVESFFCEILSYTFSLITQKYYLQKLCMNIISMT